MALMETLQDDFSTAGAPNATRWPTVVPGSGATITVTGGVLSITDTLTSYPYVFSATTYTISGSFFLAKVVPPTISGSNSQEAYIGVGPDVNNWVAVARVGTNLVRIIKTSGTDATTTIAAYNATNQAWWRVRHNGTNWFTAYSADGITWTEQSGFTTSWTATGSNLGAFLMVGKWVTGDATATGTFDNVNLASTFVSGSDTASGTDSAGTVAQKYTGTETGTGTDNAGTVVQKYTGTETGTGTDAESARKTQDTETGTGTDATASRGLQGDDTGTGTESSGGIGKTDTETATGTSSNGTVAASLTSPDTATGVEGTNRTVNEAETATGVDNAGTVRQFRADAETVSSVEGDALRILKTDSDASGTTVDTHTNRRFDGQADNPTTTENQSVNNLLPQSKSGSDTSSAAEGQTRLQPGQFSQIPSPKVWENGDDLYAGTLNKEWRDTFLWLLRGTSPAFSGYNADGASLTLTANVAIPIKVETLKRGNVTHATNDTKIYVWEPGIYVVTANVGITTSGVTGTNFSSVLKLNGVVETTGDTTRAGGTPVVIQHTSSLELAAGDYLEIAPGGSWTGTATSGTWEGAYPWIDIWWRSNA